MQQLQLLTAQRIREIRKNNPPGFARGKVAAGGGGGGGEGVAVWETMEALGILTKKKRAHL